MSQCLSGFRYDGLMVGPLNYLHDRVDARMAAVGFYLLHAAAVALWWVLLVAVPSSRAWFFPGRLTGDPLMSFWLADLVLLSGASLGAAYAVLRRQGWAHAAVWLLAGAVSYPTLYMLVLATRYGEGFVGAGLMGIAAGLCLAYALIVGRDGRPAGFRPAQDVVTAALVARITVQIVIFWGLFLALLPLAIAEAERRLGIASFSFQGHRFVGGVVFAMFAPLGLWSSWVMAKVGRGTPLPTECAPRLVVTGPYRFVRNPMAAAGIGQGVGVALMLGSYAVLVYALAGALVWHYGARPAEERDLEARFGEPYVVYRSAVRCWWPCLSYRGPWHTRGLPKSPASETSCNRPSGGA